MENTGKEPRHQPRQERMKKDRRMERGRPQNQKKGARRSPGGARR